MRLPSVSKPWIPPMLVGLIVIGMGLANLHGSSIGIYGVGVGESEAEAGVIEGPIRPIRSDEWLVRTPWVLSQDRNGLDGETVGGLGVHDAALIADLPTAGWELLLRPHTLPYHLLPGDRALAFEWWLLYGVQFAGVYTLILAVTRRWDLGALAGLLMVTSPVTQWWTGSGTYTTIGYGGLATALLLWAYRGSGRLRWLSSVAAGFSLAAFAAGLYPPWQIGAAIVAGSVAIGALAPDLADRSRRRAVLIDVARVAAPALAIAVVLMGAFFARHGDAVAAIADTVYPGQRAASEGGRVDLVRVLSAPFDTMAAEAQFALVNGTNQSENSSGLLYAIPAAVVIYSLGLIGTVHTASATVLRSVLAGCMLLGAWMLLPIPSSVGRFVLLNRVEAERVVLPLAFASVLALALVLAVLRDLGAQLPKRVVAAGVGLFLVPYAWAAGRYAVEGIETSHRDAAAHLLVVATGTSLALVRPRSNIGLGLLVAFGLWQASQINPLQHGTSALTDNSLAQAVTDIVGDGDPSESGWVLFSGDAYAKGTLTASGVDHLSAISPYPDLEAWSVLDPSGVNEEVWNRYAHISFEIGPPGSEPAFRLVNQDALVITIDPCDRALEELGVDYIVSPSSELSACTSLVRTVELGVSVLYIYER